MDENVQNTVQTAQEPEKTFTQSEVDNLISKRLERERKKYPSEEELTAFRGWRDSQQTEQQRMQTVTQERDTARTDLAAALAKVEQYEREKLLLSKGVAADDVDYYAFKIGKLVSDSKTFEQAAEEFLKEKKPTVRVDMAANLSGSSAQTPNEKMNALIRGAFH